MIEITQLSKSFDGTQALDGLNMTVRRGSIYGLIGVNGSGKTTALKAVTGVIRQDEGDITMGGEPVFDNLGIKQRLGFIPDDLFFFGSYNLNECARFYSGLYPNWNEELFQTLKEQFGLPEKRKLTRFSKGMQKQAAFILTIATQPDWLILDEPIDGLDPLVRKLVWKHVVSGVAERQMTVLVSSHNLREMEGVCDSIGILQSGKMLLERDLTELRGDIHKIQVAFADPDTEVASTELNILHGERHGAVQMLIVRGARDLAETVIRGKSPVIFDLLPLSLEEVFIYELGGLHNDVNLLF